jgi:hypothetical protein
VGIVLSPPANAANVLWVGGTGGSLSKLLQSGVYGSTADILGGAYGSDPITTIDYPSALWPITGLQDPTLGRSVSIGAAQLEAAVKDAVGPLVIVGTSQGALVVQQAEAALNNDPSVPSSTTFILIADPNFGLVQTLAGVYIPVLDYTPVAIPETRFNTIIVANQYDWIGDPITQPWNLLTELNALMALFYVHPSGQNADLSSVPEANITTTTNSQNGTTTIYHVPTDQLPLTMPLRQLGVPAAVVDGLDKQLQPLIDAGYTDPQPGPACLSCGKASARPIAPPATVKANRQAAATASAPATKPPGTAVSTNNSDTAHSTNRAAHRAHQPAV